MKLDDYLTIGRSGLRVSPLALGTMTFGEDWGMGCSVEVSEQILERYLGLGGNFLDTANFYTKGHSEVIIGDYFAKSKNRDRIVIGTKFSGNMYLKDPNGGGSSRKAIVEQCEQSLRRLKTDYIDLYWLHIWDIHTPIDETLRALDDLVSAGKIRYIGVSDTPAWKVAQAQVLADMRGWTSFIALQLEYSLLERTIEGELVPMAQELGLGITPWGPLRSGTLTGRYTRENQNSIAGDSRRAKFIKDFYLNEQAFDVIDILLEGAKELNTTPARIALSWVNNRPGVSSTLMGASSVTQLDDNLASLEIDLPVELRDRLDSATKPVLNFPAEMIKTVGVQMIGNGASVNGVQAPVNESVPMSDEEHY